MTLPVSIISTNSKAAATSEGQAPAEAPKGASFAVETGDGTNEAAMNADPTDAGGETPKTDLSEMTAQSAEQGLDAKTSPDLPDPVKVLLEQDQAAKSDTLALFEITTEAKGNAAKDSDLPPSEGSDLPVQMSAELDPEVEGAEGLELLEIAKTATSTTDAPQTAAALSEAVAKRIIPQAANLDEVPVEEVKADGPVASEIDGALTPLAAQTRTAQKNGEAKASDLSAEPEAIDTEIAALAIAQEVTETKPRRENTAPTGLSDSAGPDADHAAPKARGDITAKAEITPKPDALADGSDLETPSVAKELGPLAAVPKQIAEQPTLPAPEAPNAQPVVNMTAAQPSQPTAMPQTAMPALAMSRPEWPTQLVQEIGLRQFDDGADLEITLTPERLGTLHLKMEMRDGVANIAIVTETPEAARLFNENQQRLAEQFARIGLELGSHSAGTQAQSDTSGGGAGGLAGQGSDELDPDQNDTVMQNVEIGQSPRVDILA